MVSRKLLNALNYYSSDNWIFSRFAKSKNPTRKGNEFQGAILVKIAGSFRTSVHENPTVLSSLTYYSATRLSFGGASQARATV